MRLLKECYSSKNTRDPNITRLRNNTQFVSQRIQYILMQTWFKKIWVRVSEVSYVIRLNSLLCQHVSVFIFSLINNQTFEAIRNIRDMTISVSFHLQALLSTCGAPSAREILEKSHKTLETFVGSIIQFQIMFVLNLIKVESNSGFYLKKFLFFLVVKIYSYV